MGQHLAFVRSVPKTPSVNWEQKFSHGKKSEVWDFLLFQKISKIPPEFFPSSAFVRKQSLTCKNLEGITQALDLPVHPLRRRALTQTPAGAWEPNGGRNVAAPSSLMPPPPPLGLMGCPALPETPWALLLFLIRYGKGSGNQLFLFTLSLLSKYFEECCKLDEAQLEAADPPQVQKHASWASSAHLAA